MESALKSNVATHDLGIQDGAGACYPVLESEGRMIPATSTSLNPEQVKFKGQLAQAVEHINEADDLLVKNTNSDTASYRATALLLSAIARVLVIETGEKHNLLGRLPAFKHTK
jgi:hypothetical protein